MFYRLLFSLLLVFGCLPSAHAQAVRGSANPSRKNIADCLTEAINRDDYQNQADKPGATTQRAIRFACTNTPAMRLYTELSAKRFPKRRAIEAGRTFDVIYFDGIVRDTPDLSRNQCFREIPTNGTRPQIEYVCYLVLDVGPYLDQ